MISQIEVNAYMLGAGYTREKPKISKHRIDRFDWFKQMGNGEFNAYSDEYLKSKTLGELQEKRLKMENMLSGFVVKEGVVDNVS